MGMYEYMGMYEFMNEAVQGHVPLVLKQAPPTRYLFLDPFAPYFPIHVVNLFFFLQTRKGRKGVMKKQRGGLIFRVCSEGDEGPDPDWIVPCNRGMVD